MEQRVLSQAQQDLELQLEQSDLPVQLLIHRAKLIHFALQIRCSTTKHRVCRRHLQLLAFLSLFVNHELQLDHLVHSVLQVAKQVFLLLAKSFNLALQLKDLRRSQKKKKTIHSRKNNKKGNDLD